MTSFLTIVSAIVVANAIWMVLVTAICMSKKVRNWATKKSIEWTKQCMEEMDEI